MSDVATFWLILLNAAFGILVAIPLLAVLAVAVREALRRRPRAHFEWVDVPGVGILPVLRRSPPRRRAGGRELQTR